MQGGDPEDQGEAEEGQGDRKGQGAHLQGHEDQENQGSTEVTQKSTKRIKIHGEEFKIDDWAQCDKCQKWRKIDFKLKKNEAFSCRVAGSNCMRKQESSSQYITLDRHK